MWLGETEANVEGVFYDERAAAPYAILLDEIDSVVTACGGSGGGDDGDAGDRVLNQILTEPGDGRWGREEHLRRWRVKQTRPDPTPRFPVLVVSTSPFISRPSTSPRYCPSRAPRRKSPIDSSIDIGLPAKNTHGISAACQLHADGDRPARHEARDHGVR